MAQLPVVVVVWPLVGRGLHPDRIIITNIVIIITTPKIVLLRILDCPMDEDDSEKVVFLRIVDCPIDEKGGAFSYIFYLISEK